MRKNTKGGKKRNGREGSIFQPRNFNSLTNFPLCFFSVCIGCSSRINCPFYPPAISYRPFALQKVRYFCYSSHSRASSWPRSHPPDFSFQTYLSETLVYPSPRIIRRISSRQQREKLRPSLFTILETAILLLSPSSQIPLTFQPRFPRSFKTSHISRIPPYSTAENSPILSLSNVPFEKNIDVEGGENVRSRQRTACFRDNGSKNRWKLDDAAKGGGGGEAEGGWLKTVGEKAGGINSR